MLNRLGDRSAMNRTVPRQHDRGVHSRELAYRPHGQRAVVIEERGDQLGTAFSHDRVGGDQRIAGGQRALTGKEVPAMAGGMARARYGDRPASRYEEGSIDIQPVENLHYRPLYSINEQSWWLHKPMQISRATP